MGWGQAQEQLGAEVVAEFKSEIEDWRGAYDQLWHRRGAELDVVRRLLAAHTAKVGDVDPATDALAAGLQRLLLDQVDKPQLPSPHEMRTRHLQQRSRL